MAKETFKEMIVQSTVAKRMIETVSPIYEDSYVGCWMFEDIGREWERIWAIIDELPDQLFPQSASWLLSFWEERYGITPNIGDDDETRRSRVMEAEAPPQPFTPFTLNRWVYANSRRRVIVNDHIAPYTFAVFVVNQPDSLPLDFGKLYKYIVKHKQSHMSFELYLESDEQIKIKVETMYWRFPYRQSGTEPWRNVPGGLERTRLRIKSHPQGYEFPYLMTGTRDAGTEPEVNITTGTEKTQIKASGTGRAITHRYPLAGTLMAGNRPL